MANLLLLLAVAFAALVSMATAAPPASSMRVDATKAKPVNMTVYYESLCPGCNYYITESLGPLWPRIKDLEAKPVNMTVYYESLCPGCNYYITESLGPLWPRIKDLDLMTVNLVPFGNAEERRIGFGWEFTCQHGSDECVGNIVETCLIHYYPNTTTYLEMVACFSQDFFSSIGADWKQSLQKCKTTGPGIDVEKIETCVTGREGNELEHIMAMNTGPHTYTPFIMLDGVENKYAEEHLLIEVCHAYKGKKPKICFE